MEEYKHIIERYQKSKNDVVKQIYRLGFSPVKDIYGKSAKKLIQINLKNIHNNNNIDSNNYSSQNYINYTSRTNVVLPRINPVFSYGNLTTD